MKIIGFDLNHNKNNNKKLDINLEKTNNQILNFDK